MTYEAINIDGSERGYTVIKKDESGAVVSTMDIYCTPEDNSKDSAIFIFQDAENSIYSMNNPV